MRKKNTANFLEILLSHFGICILEMSDLFFFLFTFNSFWIRMLIGISNDIHFSHFRKGKGLCQISILLWHVKGDYLKKATIFHFTDKFFKMSNYLKELKFKKRLENLSNNYVKNLSKKKLHRNCLWITFIPFWKIKQNKNLSLKFLPMKTKTLGHCSLQ
jgi:hypothetical protein